MPRHNSRVWPAVFLGPALVLMTLIGIYPLLYSLFASFQRLELNNLADAPFVGLANFGAILTDLDFRNSALVSLRFVTVSVTASFLLGLGFALLMNREGRGMALLRSLFIIPMIVAPVAVGLTWRLMYNNEAGLINYLLAAAHLGSPTWLADPAVAPWAVVIVDVWEWTPFVFLLLLAGLRSMPLTPFEAARIDGASTLQVFRFVTWPLLRPAILVAVILRAIDAFRIFDQIYVMTKGGPIDSTDVASFFVYRVGFLFLHVGYATAISWVMVVIASLLVTWFVRATGFLAENR
jgi:multiple sugar transport system permease protein